ncbi:MAG: multicopper oxidase domain-containing protein, partial [Gemmatimonadetes bacterium]|nr:multicopper oxidase domain-containing protein [Gemmatimonadota bacterium]
MRPRFRAGRMTGLSLLAGLAATSPARAQDRVVPNDNRVPAGTRSGSVVRVSLVARVAIWHPDGANAPGAPMFAFAEASGPARIPGPLLRAPAGTEAVVRLRNALTDTLRVFGLFGRTEPLPDTMPVVLAPGEARELRLRLDRPGTYHYWGTTTRRLLGFRTGEDSQLSGAIVIDPPRGQRRTIPDRVFVVGMWSDTVHRVGTKRARVLGVINGQSWPGTERLTATVGDTLRWRVINTTADLHPMHLHGAYFRVTRRGDIAVDTAYQPRAGAGTGDLAVTESMTSGQTMLMEWVPERAGNWLFHCHVPEHFERRGPLGTQAPRDAAVAHDHADGGMGGLVMGIAVRSRRPVFATPPVGPTTAERRIRLLVRANQSGTDSVPYFGYALHEGGAEPPPASGLVSAPVLDLVR